VARTVDAPPLDPSSGEGRRLLADELAKPEYSPQESLLRRAVDVVVEWFRGLLDDASGGPISFWWYAVVAGGAILLLGAVVWALLRLEPARRRRRVAAGSVFDESGLSADDYRRRARAASAAGDHAAAVLDGYRALVAGSVERFVLDDHPGATAREIAGSLGRVFAAESARLRDAAGVFDAVRYGDERPAADQAQAVLDLEDRIRVAAPVEGTSA
jgi:hypothetical protein